MSLLPMLLHVRFSVTRSESIPDPPNYLTSLSLISPGYTMRERIEKGMALNETHKHFPVPPRCRVLSTGLQVGQQS